MFVLTRPRSDRLISGVAVGISELYGIPVILVRLLFVCAFITAPIIALLYLLLAISIPDEENVVTRLVMELPGSFASPRERFEASSKILFDRFVGRKSGRLWPTQVVAIALLVFAAVLELPRVEGDSFYYLHPIMTVVSSEISQSGSILLYLMLAIAMFVAWERSSALVRLPMRSSVLTEAEQAGMISGIASNLGETLQIDPAYLRVLFLFLNILTVGLAGVAYIVITYYRRRRKSEATMKADVEDVQRPIEARNGYSIRILLGLLFLFYVGLLVVDQYRLFFFNEIFASGLVVLLAGLAISGAGFRGRKETSSLLLIGGAGVFYVGIYLLAVAIGRIQVTVAGQFEIGEIIAGLSIAYYAISLLSGKAREKGLVLALTFIAASILIHIHIVPLRYLVAIAQFYSFFFPVIFAGLGLWITFEK